MVAVNFAVLDLVGCDTGTAVPRAAAASVPGLHCTLGDVSSPVPMILRDVGPGLCRREHERARLMRPASCGLRRSGLRADRPSISGLPLTHLRLGAP